MKIIDYMILLIISIISSIVIVNIALVQTILSEAGINAGEFLIGILLFEFLFSTIALAVTYK
jgi:hypothetical protein